MLSDVPRKSSRSWHSGNFSSQKRKVQIFFPRTASFFLSPSHAHPPTLGFEILQLNHNGMSCLSSSTHLPEPSTRASSSVSSWGRRYLLRPPLFPALSMGQTPPSFLSFVLTLVSIVCPPQHQEPRSPPGPRPGPAHQARGQDRLRHLPP